MNERILTQEAQAFRDDFNWGGFRDGGCRCFIYPPCGYCTHPGNPRNQDEEESCWMVERFDIEDALQDARDSVAELIEVRCRELDDHVTGQFWVVYARAVKRTVALHKELGVSL